MNRKTAIFLIVVIVLAAVGVSVLAYPKLPDRMASHWGPGGQVDGWMPKSICVWIMPGIMLFQTVLFFVILRIDPLRKNIDIFFGYYAGFTIILNLFLLAVQGWMILWNLNIQISSNIFMPIGLACLTFYSGIVMNQVKPNSFWGVRPWGFHTPFTLGHEIVWQKTHKLGGILFRIAAIIMLLGAIFPKYAIYFIVIPIMLATAIESFYSYAIWKKLKKERLGVFKPFKQNMEEAKNQLFGKS